MVTGMGMTEGARMPRWQRRGMRARKQAREQAREAQAGAQKQAQDRRAQMHLVQSPDPDPNLSSPPSRDGESSGTEQSICARCIARDDADGAELAVVMVLHAAAAHVEVDPDRVALFTGLEPCKVLSIMDRMGLGVESGAGAGAGKGGRCAS